MIPLLPYLLIGAVLGAAVLVLSIRALLLPVGALGGVAMIIWPRLAFFALIATLPVYFGFGTGTRFQMALLLPILGVMLLNAFTRRGAWPMVVRWPEGYLALAFCTGLVASVFASPYPLYSGLAMVGVYAPMAFFFFATLSFVRTRQDVDTVLWVLVGVGVLQAFLTILETRTSLVFSVALLRARAENTLALDEGLGAVGTTWHPSVLGAFLVMTTAIAVYFALRSRRLPARVLLLAAALLMLYGTYLTYSRVAWFCMAGAAAIGLLTASRLARYAAAAIGFILVLLLAARDFSLATLIQDFENAFMPAGLKRGGSLLNSAWFALVYRFETWGIAWNMFKSAPLLGVGMGSTALGWTPTFLPSWATTWGLITSPNQPNAGVCHNAFLGMLAEHGLFSFAALLGLWFWGMRCIYRALRHPEFHGHAVLFSAMLACQFVYLMLNPVSRDFAVTLALAMAVARMSTATAPALAPATSPRGALPLPRPPPGEAPA